METAYIEVISFLILTKYHNIDKNARNRDMRNEWGCGMKKNEHKLVGVEWMTDNQSVTEKDALASKRIFSNINIGAK